MFAYKAPAANGAFLAAHLVGVGGANVTATVALSSSTVQLGGLDTLDSLVAVLECEGLSQGNNKAGSLLLQAPANPITCMVFMTAAEPSSPPPVRGRLPRG